MPVNNVNTRQTQDFLNHLMSISYNRKCADCGKQQPTWASVSFSFFICYDCAALHRSLGPNISKVKNTAMDIWTIDELRRMYVGGNKNAYKIPENVDLRLKYKECDFFKEEIDNLLKKSEKNEPGDSFLNLHNEKSAKEFGNAVVKKKMMPKLNDKIQIDEEEPVSEVCKPKQKSKEELPQYVDLNTEVSLQRSKKGISLKKNVNCERSPFSFTPKELDEN